ncbi:MAG: hypothetical protein R2710_06605 [Acidimicrobiales bacterium]
MTDEAAATLFWDLIDELQAEDPRVHEGTIMAVGALGSAVSSSPSSTSRAAGSS